jgi:UrcA family protein
MHRNTILAGLALITTLGCGIPAALAASEVASERVQVKDLDLATPHGQHVLDARVAAAIEHVCGLPYSRIEQTQAAERRQAQCKAAARTDVQRQLQSHGVQTARAARTD